MAPPHLHPRSRMTSSLFATTVLASFLVVALPHILPCPAPRRAYADGGDMSTMQQDQQQNSGVVRRVRRRSRGESSPREGGVGGSGMVGGGGGEDGVGVVEFRPRSSPSLPSEGGERGAKRRGGRECPVPKPGGILGEWLGFHAGAGGGGGGGGDSGGKEGGEKARPVR